MTLYIVPPIYADKGRAQKELKWLYLTYNRLTLSTLQTAHF